MSSQPSIIRPSAFKPVRRVSKAMSKEERLARNREAAQKSRIKHSKEVDELREAVRIIDEQQVEIDELKTRPGWVEMHLSFMMKLREKEEPSFAYVMGKEKE